MRRVLAFIVGLAVFSQAVRADGPPTPPPAESHGVIQPGSSVTLTDGSVRVVPEKGALYMEEASWIYQTEKIRWLKVENEAAKKVADRRASTGFYLGATVAAVVLVGICAAKKDCRNSISDLATFKW